MNSLTSAFRNWFFSAAESCSPPLEFEALMAHAEKRTGLNDWGDKLFEAPLRVLLDSLNRESPLSAQGRFIISQHFSRLLRNWLQLRRDWKTHPAIHNVAIAPPLFVIGLPRTGTTYLHSLLALDPNHRALRYWELLFPSPPPHPEPYSRDRRIRKARGFTFFIDRLAPRLARIHQLHAEGVEECCFIFDHLFLDSMNHLVCDVPTYMRWYQQHDPAPSYQFHQQMLRHYALNFDFQRYVLKAPRHLFGLKGLLNEYPDALIVWSHRDRAQALASLCSLTETAQQIVLSFTDRRRIGRMCLEHVQSEFAAAAQARTQAHPHQFFDVHCEQLTHQPIQTIQKLYNHFGLNYGSEFDQRLHSRLHQSQQPQLRRQVGRHHYSLQDYGLSPEDVENAFSQFSGLTASWRRGDELSQGD